VQNSSLIIREATQNDQIVAWALLNRLKEHYFEDYQLQAGFSPSDLDDWIANGNLSVICLTVLDAELVVGAVLLDDIHPDLLHGRFHLLVDPVHYKKVKHHNGVVKAVEFTFQRYNVKKLNARPMKPQTSAIKLLKKHFFWFGDAMPNEAKFKGKLVSVIPCHLTRSYWDRRKGELNG